MPEVFVGGQLGIDALGLEHHADLATEVRGVLCSVTTHDEGAASGGDHQCGKDAEERGLAAAIGTEEPEEFGGADIKGDAVERGAVFVAMDEVLYGDNGFGRGTIHPYSFSYSGDFRDQAYPQDWYQFTTSGEELGVETRVPRKGNC